MSSIAQITIHQSQFPQNVSRELLESLRVRKVNHKFHYDTVKQANKWLAVAAAYAPFHTQSDGAAIYEAAFDAVAQLPLSSSVHIIGLGCGGGQKDAQLLKQLRRDRPRLFYTPSDTSVPMVLVARKAALELVSESDCFPLVCDLAAAEDIADVLARFPIPQVSRLFTFFGMLPNFEPALVLPRVAALVRPGDSLLLSANLAPGNDYAIGMEQIFRQYANPPTAEWLLTFLLDLGIERGDGNIQFSIEDAPGNADLKRVAAYFEFTGTREINVESQCLVFSPGDSVRLFFSYRHTPSLVQSLLESQGLRVAQQWFTRSAEEGIFLVTR